MSISRIELQGTVARTQDYSTIKQNEDNKGMINQLNFQNEFKKEIDERMTQVNKSEEIENMNKRYDAKEKGNGHYDGDGGRNRQSHSEKMQQDRVIVKRPGGFDMKI